MCVLRQVPRIRSTSVFIVRLIQFIRLHSHFVGRIRLCLYVADPTHRKWIGEVDEEDEGDEERQQSHDDRIIDQGMGNLIDRGQHQTAHYQEHQHAQREKDLLDDRGRGSRID